MSGPAPKHPSVRARRNAGAGMTTLPSAGRTGATPPWPLSQDSSLQAGLDIATFMVDTTQAALDAEDDGRKRRTLTGRLEKALTTQKRLEIEVEHSGGAELALWTELWATPQAVEWERTFAHRSVAMYVRWQVKAENGHIEAAKHARMWSDRLGLNPLALQRLKQEVERADAAESQGRQRRGAATPPAPTADDGKGTKGDSNDPRSGLYAVS